MLSSSLQRALSAPSSSIAAAPRAFPRVSQRASSYLPPRSIPVPKTDVIADADSAKLEKMKTCFKMADIDECVLAAFVCEGGWQRKGGGVGFLVVSRLDMGVLPAATTFSMHAH